MNCCVAFGSTPLLAVIVIGYIPPVPAAGVPINKPVELNTTGLGNEPVSLNLGVGDPVATTWNEPIAPTVNVVEVPLVITGADEP